MPRPPPPATPAQFALDAWCAAERGRQEVLRKTLGVSQAAVSRWASGRTRPDPHLREAIELVTGIPRDDWMADVERAQLATLRATLGVVPCTCTACGFEHWTRAA